MKTNAIFFTLLISALISCGNDQSKFVGKWNIQKFEDNGAEEFHSEPYCIFEEDGFFIIQDGNNKYRGKWSIISDSNEIKLDLFEEETIINGKYSFEKDKLIIKGTMETHYVLIEMIKA